MIQDGLNAALLSLANNWAWGHKKYANSFELKYEPKFSFLGMLILMRVEQILFSTIHALKFVILGGSYRKRTC